MSNQENKYSVELNITNEFFVGNLNKQKTRDEIFQDLTSIKIKSLNDENLYISKFNMPKFNARKDQNGNLLLNLGYAFVTTKRPEMAQWMIQQKRIQLDDGSDIEIKPISKTKRLTANQNCKVKNYSKLNGTDDGYKGSKVKHGAIGEGRSEKHMRYTNSRENIYNNSSENVFRNSSDNYFSNSSENMFGLNDGGLFGNYNTDSVGNSVNNSINSTKNSSTIVNSFNLTSQPNNNSGNSLFGNDFNNDFDRNFAPASLNYKKPEMQTQNHIWQPFPTDNQDDLYKINTTEQNNNSIFNVARQKSLSEDYSKPEVLTGTDSTENSPTNSDLQVVFRSS